MTFHLFHHKFCYIFVGMWMMGKLGTFTPDEIISKLRETGHLAGGGNLLAQVPCRH